MPKWRYAPINQSITKMLKCLIGNIICNIFRRACSTNQLVFLCQPIVFLFSSTMFLYSYEADFIHVLLKKKEKKLVRSFIFTSSRSAIYMSFHQIIPCVLTMSIISIPLNLDKGHHRQR